MGPKKKGKGKEEPEVKNKEDETEQVITKYTLIYIYQCWRSDPFIHRLLARRGSRIL